MRQTYHHRRKRQRAGIQVSISGIHCEPLRTTLAKAVNTARPAQNSNGKLTRRGPEYGFFRSVLIAWVFGEVTYTPPLRLERRTANGQANYSLNQRLADAGATVFIVECQSRPT